MSQDTLALTVILTGDPQQAAPTLRALADDAAGADGWEVLVAPGRPEVPEPLATQDVDLPEGRAWPVVAARAARGRRVAFLLSGSAPARGTVRRLLEAGESAGLVLVVEPAAVDAVQGRAPWEIAERFRRLGGQSFPAHWVDDVDDAEATVDPARVLWSRLLTDHSRQICPVDAVPGGPDDAPARPASIASPEAAADVIAGIVGDLGHFPEERGPLVQALVDDLLAGLDFLGAGPGPRGVLGRALKMRGVQDIDLSDSRDPWPTLGNFIDDDVPLPPNFTLLCADAGQLKSERGLCSLLRLGGSNVRAATYRGEPDPKLRLDFRRIGDHGGEDAVSPLSRARAFAARAERSVRRRVLRAALTPKLLPPVVFRDPAIRDEGIARWAEDTVVVAVDDFGRRAAIASGLDWVPLEQLDAWAVVAVARRSSVTLGQTRSLRRSLKRLRLSRTDITLPSAELFHLAAYRVALSGREEGARAVLAACAALHPGSKDRPEHRLIELLIHVGGTMEFPAETEQVLRESLAEAERRYADDEQHRLFVLQLAAHIVFHPDAQTVVPKPALFARDRDLVGALETSPSWRAIAPTVLPDGPRPRTDDDRARVLLLQGSYPRFSKVVRDALAERQPVDAVDFTMRDSRMQGVGPSMWGTSVCRDIAQGITSTVPLGFEELLQGRDVIFCDWADRGSVMAAALAPEGTRIVVRFHGADGLSMWQYLIDWRRVSDAIFVSEHLKDAVTAILGDRLVDTRVHVVSNIIDFDKFDRPKTDDAHRTLGLVGWAQRVKDPIWALDVLAILRQQDPSWNLTLVGRDFPRDNPRLTERDYGIDFQARALRDDVVDGIRYVDFTSDLPRHLAGVGFAMSSSLRESNPVGVMEMLAAGAVPVVRDWPVFAHVGGPRAMLPPEWVVRTPEEAAARIAALSDRSAWEAAVEEVRAVARERFGTDLAARRYREIVFGEE